MNKIIIVGGGFGGIRTALDLEKIFRKDLSVSITLIDQRDYHLFNPNLYKVAASEEELTSISQLKQSIALPFKEILAKRKINFLKGRILGMDFNLRKISVKGKSLDYDYLILATGSIPNFYQIPGASEFALSLNNLTDAFRIRNAVEFALQAGQYSIQKKTIRIVLAGGGFSSVKLAGELMGLLDFVAWKNNYPKEKLEVEILESQERLMPGESGKLSQDSYFRLKNLGVQISFFRHIVKVDRHLIEFLNGEKMEYDLLIWTAGNKANSKLDGLLGYRNGKEKIEVNEFLEVKGADRVFAIGDLSFYKDAQGNQTASTYKNAVSQGKYLASALPKLMKNVRPQAFKPKPYSFTINIGKNWAIYKGTSKYLTGYAAYLLGWYSQFVYFRSLVGIRKTLRHLLS